MVIASLVYHALVLGQGMTALFMRRRESRCPYWSLKMLRVRLWRAESALGWHVSFNIIHDTWPRNVFFLTLSSQNLWFLLDKHHTPPVLGDEQVRIILCISVVGGRDQDRGEYTHWLSFFEINPFALGLSSSIPIDLCHGTAALLKFDEIHK